MTTDFSDLKAKAEKASADQPQADPVIKGCLTTEGGDGWIAWAGGNRPVSHNKKVEVRLRGNFVDTRLAGVLDWACSGTSLYDIIAYRVVG